MATQVSLNSGAVASAGALALQTNGTTQAVSISTGQVATLAQNPILTSGTINGVAYLNGTNVLTTGTTVGGLQLWSTTSATHYVNFGDGVSSADNYRGYVGYVHASDALIFGASTVEQMRLTSTGLKTAGTISVGNATPSTSGAGITFPATQSASTDANTLDDYEEGTTIVTLTPATSGTITLNNSYKTLAYTKVGRLVTVTGELLVSSVSTPIGSTVNIGNLPFVVANGNESSASSPILDLGTGTYAPARASTTAAFIDLRVNASTIGANYNIIVGFSYMTST